MANRLHCPYCKDDTLIAAMETDSSNSIHNVVGGPMATSTGFTKYHNRHYWMCRDCGKKFRNIEDLKGEIKKYQKTEKVWKIFSIILLPLIFFLLTKLDTLMITLPFLIIFLLVFLVVFLEWNSCKKRIKIFSEELVWLEEKCFD